MKYKGQERRKHPRIPIGARVTIEGAGIPDYLFTRDLSLGGVGLASDNPPPIGTTLMLELSISGMSRLIKVQGTVVRHISLPEKGFGVHFTRFRPYSKRMLEKALEGLVEA